MCCGEFYELWVLSKTLPDSYVLASGTSYDVRHSELGTFLQIIGCLTRGGRYVL